MTLPSFKEDHISQIPALQLLQQLGWKYLSPDEAVAARGGKLSSVLPDTVLVSQLKKLNQIDDVIIHERCHLKIHDHSLLFYRTLTRVLPDWEMRKDRLESQDWS